jgi:energy-coupling factor transporter ATP-binding protein EcfA2
VRLTTLAATGLLSFGARRGSEPAFSLDFDDTTVVIGPNASGKSNLVTLLYLVLAVVRACASPTLGGRYVSSEGREELAVAGKRLRHHKFPDGEDAEIRVGIELNTPEERDLLVTFLRATLVSQLTTNNPDNVHRQCWLRVNELTDEVFSTLLRGTLVASHSGASGCDWRLRFEPSEPVDGAELIWDLFMNSGELRRVGAPTASQQPDLHSRLGLPSPLQQVGPDGKLTSSFDAGSFRLSQLVLDPPDRVHTVVTLQGLGQDQLAPVVRRFLDLAGIAPPPMGRTSIGAAYVWHRLLERGVQVIDTATTLGSRDTAGWLVSSWVYTAQSLSRPATWATADLPRRLWQLHNGGPEEEKQLATIREHFTALAGGRKFTVGGRIVERSTEAPAIPLQSLASGGQALGGIAGGQAAPAMSVPAPAGGEGIAPTIELRVELFVDEPAGRTLPLTAAGSGVGQALVLAEALGAARNKVTVLDEPACNLHPEWQQLVREALDKAASAAAVGPCEVGQLFLVTHSPFLAAPSRLNGERRKLPTRLLLDKGVSVAVPPPSETQLEDWPLSLRHSAEGWALLFAMGVLLVEGETEVGALPIWFDKIAQERHERSWSARDLAIFSVGGHKSFYSWAKFLHYYRVPFTVCCDGQALDPWQPVKDERKQITGWVPNRHWILSQLAKAGQWELAEDVRSLQAKKDAREEAAHRAQHPDSPEFEQVRAVAGRYWVSTVASWFQGSDVPRSENAPREPIESIDDLIDQDQLLARVKAEIEGGRGKVRVGAEVAAKCDPPEAVRDLFGDVVGWLCGEKAPSPTKDRSAIYDESQEA